MLLLFVALAFLFLALFKLIVASSIVDDPYFVNAITFLSSKEPKSPLIPSGEVLPPSNKGNPYVAGAIPPLSQGI